MIDCMRMYVDNASAPTEGANSEDIWTIEVQFRGSRPNCYIMSVSSDVSPIQLAQDFRAFANSMEFGIEGEWH